MAPAHPAEPVVLVTGAGRGLGRGIARQLAAAGCSVAVNFVTDRRAAGATLALCRRAARSRRQRFRAVQADIAAPAGRAQLVAATLGEFGRIDVLVNNAGIAPRARVDLLAATEASFDEVLGVNLKGPHFLTQAVARHWRAARPGPAPRQVIFVTSVSADTVSLNRGDYCVSKAGLSMVARLWAVRLAPLGIPVFELRPGIMDTDMTAPARGRYGRLIRDGLVPQRRWGRAEDVGLAVRALVEGRFPFSSGAVIPIDGGLHLRRL